MKNSRFQFGLGTLVIFGFFACIATAFIVKTLEFATSQKALEKRIELIERKLQFSNILTDLRSRHFRINDRLGNQHPDVRFLAKQIELVESIMKGADYEFDGKTYVLTPND